MKFPFTTYDDQIPSLFIPNTEHSKEFMLKEAQCLNKFIKEYRQDDETFTLFNLGSFKDEILNEQYTIKNPEVYNNQSILLQKDTLFPLFLMYPFVLNDKPPHYKNIDIILIAPSKNLEYNKPNELTMDNTLFEYFILPLHPEYTEDELREILMKQEIKRDTYSRYIDFVFPNIKITYRWFYTMIPSTPEHYIQYTKDTYVHIKYKHLIHNKTYIPYCNEECFTDEDIAFSNEFQNNLIEFFKRNSNTLCINYVVFINKSYQSSLIKPFLNSTKYIIHYFNHQLYFIDNPYSPSKSRAWLYNMNLEELSIYYSIEQIIRMNSFQYTFKKRRPDIKYLYKSNIPPLPSI